MFFKKKKKSNNPHKLKGADLERIDLWIAQGHPKDPKELTSSKEREIFLQKALDTWLDKVVYYQDGNKRVQGKVILVLPSTIRNSEDFMYLRILPKLGLKTKDVSVQRARRV